MNIRIYSWGEKSLERMSEYICSGKIHEYLGEWIYSSINIWVYLNIRIFATHCNTATLPVCTPTQNNLDVCSFY